MVGKEAPDALGEALDHKASWVTSSDVFAAVGLCHSHRSTATASELCCLGPSETAGMPTVRVSLHAVSKIHRPSHGPEEALCLGLRRTLVIFQCSHGGNRAYRSALTFPL